MHAAWLGSLDHPIFGMGPYCWLDGYAEYIHDRHNPHNVWMKSSVETGFVGLGLFLTVIGAVCVNLKRVSSRALSIGDKRASALALALLASIVGICAALTFLSQPYWEFLWAILATGGGFCGHYMATFPKLKAQVQKARLAKKQAATQGPPAGGIGHQAA
jgi:O-antigen ligase